MTWGHGTYTGFSPSRATLDGTVGELLPYLPLQTVPLHARDRLRAVASWLPAGLTSLVYFEARLGRPDAPVDMILCVEEPGHSLLADGSWRPAHLRGASLSDPWSRLEQWAARWLTPTTRPSNAGVSHILWVEFDVDEVAAKIAATRPPSPSVFVGFRPRVVSATTGPDELRAALAGCQPILDDVSSARLRRVLPDILRALPDGAWVEYLGCMMSRPGSPIRICFRHLSWDDLWSFAEAIGWPDDPMLRSAASAAAGRVGPAVVHMDVGDAVGPSLGLECLFDRRSQVFGKLPDREFFDTLSAGGVIPSHTWDDLSAWPGCSRALFAHQLWPSVLVRRVNHVKLVGRPGSLPLAKAYMCGGQRYFPPGHRAASPRAD